MARGESNGHVTGIQGGGLLALLSAFLKWQLLCSCFQHTKFNVVHQCLLVVTICIRLKIKIKADNRRNCSSVLGCCT